MFRGKDSGKPVLLLVSGANRVDQKGVAASIGEALDRPDAAFVREVTGFAIGGIPPFGHAQPLPTWIDRDLLKFDDRLGGGRVTGSRLRGRSTAVGGGDRGDGDWGEGGGWGYGLSARTIRRTSCDIMQERRSA